MIARASTSGRAGAALALTVALAACSSANSAAGGPGRGGSGGGTGSGGSAGADAGAHCQVNILPVIPTSFDGLTAAPGARLRVSGSVTGLPPGNFSWTWTATFADGTPVPVTMVGVTPSLVELPIDQPGSYTIEVMLDGSLPCDGRRTVVAARAGGKLGSFRFRFVPPSSGDPVQEQEVQVVGGTPSGGNVIVLEAGTLVPVDTRDATTGQAAPAYVRFTDPSSGLVFETRAGTGTGAAQVRLPSATFQVLVVPDGDLAPTLLAGKRPADLAGMGVLSLARGEPVSGTVRDAHGPVAGAHVVLHAGALPSTMATTGPAGTFTLHAAAGSTYAATVTVPLAGAASAGAGAADAGAGLDPGAPMLEAVLPATDGVSVPPGGLAGVDVAIADYAPAALDLKIQPKTAQGTVEVGTHALVLSVALDSLVTFAVGGQTRPASARARADLAPSADGSLSAASLPPASYHVTVVPGPDDMPDAITAADVTLPLAGAAPQPLPLIGKVSMSGRLLPTASSGDIALTAIDVTGDLPFAIPGATGADGMFAIAVSPQRTYNLRARPGPDRALASAVFASFTVAATPLTVADQTMPAALLYAGQVRDHSASNGSPSTLVQVFCLAGAAGCDDPNTALAETVTASDGSFALSLPDPGVN
jgi:hypothetical protein